MAANLRQEYQIRQLVDERLDDEIIDSIRKLVQQTDLSNNRRMGRAQFSNLQNVARDTNSVRVIFTWIRYQVGRQPAAWRELGPALLKELDGRLQKLSGEIADEVIAQDRDQNYGDKERRRLIRRIWLLLIRQYVGQLQRYVLGYQGD